MKNQNCVRVTRRLVVESLESRNLLAAGGVYSPPVLPPAPATSLVLTTLETKVQDIMPGEKGVVLTEFTVRANKGAARLNGVTLVNIGDGLLNYNLGVLTLRADLNGKAKDGCETVLATAWSNQDEVVDLLIARSVWALPGRPVEMQVTADSQTWLRGDTIGLALVQAWGSDLRGNPLPESRIAYAGAEPVLHELQSESLMIYQQPVRESGDVALGEKDVPFLNFNASWTPGVSPIFVAVEATAGSLANASNYQLRADYNWDGVTDDTSPGLVVGGCAVFTLVHQEDGGTSGNYTVVADITSAMPADPRLQLALNAEWISATDQDGRFLQGVMVNGQGIGQMQIWSSPESSPVRTIKEDPKIFIAELPAPEYAYALPGSQDSVLLDSFEVSGLQAFQVYTVVVESVQGDLGCLTDFVLSWDSDNDGDMDGQAQGTLIEGARKVVFSNFGLEDLRYVRFEARASVPQDASKSDYVRAGLVGVKTGLPDENVLQKKNLQSFWYFGKNLG